MVTSSSTTSAFFTSRLFATVTWKRGQREGFRRKRFRIIVARGAKPVQKGSGLSEKALTKPVLFFWRKMRRMNASSDVATTLV